LLGESGIWSGQPEIREVSEEGGPDYPVISGDYAAASARWASRPIEPGRPLAPPKPIFKKLDESIVEEELARLADGS
jgi:methionyl-tRNA synthetase